MTSWKGWLRLAGVLVFVTLAGCTQPGERASRQQEVQSAVSASVVTQPMTAKDNPSPVLQQVPVAKTVYSVDEIHQFMTAARAAEAIEDPLQRCLAYPDPPHSHWSHEAVVAYCRYRLRPMISTAEINALIRSGQTAELDHRLAAALHAQLTQPEAQGLLDEIYLQDFRYDSAKERPLLDAWKRASPKSAFAYAASGYAYEEMAQDARGEDYSENTAPAKLQSMSSLLALAENDLQQALALEPRLTPAYVAWIDGANIGRTRDFVENIGERARAAAPADYAIYSDLMFARQPIWGGSPQAMEQLASQAQAYAVKNPLLKLLLTEALFYEASDCHCDPSIQLANYHEIFDQLPTTAIMWRAGDLASDNGHPGMVVVYLSETLRFLPYNPLATHARANRSFSLTLLGYPQWALAEADKVVAADPQFDAGFKARGLAYEALQDYPHAVEALRRAIALDPSSSWQLIELGNLYGYKTREWDKAWEISSQVTRKFPDEAYGWVLRAMIQMDEPRAGLKDTYDQFNARFGNDPNHQTALSEMRESLKQQAGRGGLSSSKLKSRPH
jgi:tetratricopeptide (TPR) repeat protein